MLNGNFRNRYKDVIANTYLETEAVEKIGKELTELYEKRPVSTSSVNIAFDEMQAYREKVIKKTKQFLACAKFIPEDEKIEIEGPCPYCFEKADIKVENGKTSFYCLNCYDLPGDQIL